MTAPPSQVLVLEDDPAIRDVVRTALEAKGYQIADASSGEMALKVWSAGKFDLVLVDLGLPDRDGLEVIAQLRDVSTVPILVLSARTQEEQKVKALDLGADDYITKPFNINEMLARVRAALRRHPPAQQSALLRFGDTAVDIVRHEATRDGLPLRLTPVEFRLLECLARNANLIVTSRKIIREVWGPDRVNDLRNLRVFVQTLRAKIEPDPRRPRYLLTEVGLGYRLCIDQ